MSAPHVASSQFIATEHHAHDELSPNGNIDRIRRDSEIEDEDEDDDLFDDEDENYGDRTDEVEDFDIASGNPNDYTKSYNRQRRLIDPALPSAEKPKTNTQKPKANVAAFIDDQISSLSKHAAKLRLDNLQGDDKSAQSKDKSDRATSEQVLDPRTRMILLQMINRNVVSEINGCVSTGKEANVYHATSVLEDDVAASKPVHRAIKIFKTSILVFKDRDKYITGEHRFKQGYKGSNRAMVKVWAEKEFRNLKRIHAAGIPSPEPVQIRSHVIVMGFIGDRKGWSAPRLRDVKFEEPSQWKTSYFTVLGYMRVMFQTCKLVHADLSEFNLLWYQNQIWVIDVGQSVEHDHPRSLEFLRMDLKNVSDFFRRQGVDTISERSAFEFIVRRGGSLEQFAMQSALELVQKSEPEQNDGDADDVDLEVFRQQYIPQNLQQVYDVERDVERVQKGDTNSLVYESLLATDNTPKDTEVIAKGEPEAEEDGGSDSVDENGSEQASGSESYDDDDESKPRGKRFMDKDEKKEHKLRVKEEKRERRKTKMPKNVKKKLINSSSKGKR